MATDDAWRLAEKQVTAACYAVGAIGFLLGANGCTDAEKLTRIAGHIETLNTALGLSTPAVLTDGETR